MGIGSGLSGIGSAVRRPPPRPVPQTVAPALQQIARTVASQPIVRHAPPARPTGRGLQSVAHTVARPAAQQARQAAASGASSSAVRQLMMATLAFAHQRQAALDLMSPLGAGLHSPNVFALSPFGSGGNPFSLARTQAQLATIRAAQQQPLIQSGNLTTERRLERSMPAYRDWVNSLWKQASKFYPKGARQPRLDLQGPLLLEHGPYKGLLINESQLGGAAGWVTRGDPTVHIPASTVVNAFQGGGSPLRPPKAGNAQAQAFAHAVPLHEWAHVFQGPQAWASHMATEGGAEAFTQMVAPQVGLRPGWPGGNYRQLAQALLAQRGRDYVLHGQFAGGGLGP